VRDLIESINEFLLSIGVTYQIEVTAAKKFFGIQDNYAETEVCENKNSLRGDHVRSVLQNRCQLINRMFDAMVERTKDESEKKDLETQRNMTLKMWDAWNVIEPILTEVTNPKTKAPLEDFTVSEIEKIKKDIKCFEQTLTTLFPEFMDPKQNIITPYIHYVCGHLGDLIDIHNRIARFQNQGKAIHFETHKFIPELFRS